MATAKGKTTDTTMARRSFPERAMRFCFFPAGLPPPNRRGRKIMQAMSKIMVRISWIPAKGPLFFGWSDLNWITPVR